MFPYQLNTSVDKIDTSAGSILVDDNGKSPEQLEEEGDFIDSKYPDVISMYWKGREIKRILVHAAL